MCIRFSISTKVKTIPFFVALVLSIANAFLSNLQNALIVFGFDIFPFRGFIFSVILISMGSLMTLAMNFITPRIDKKLQILHKEYFSPLFVTFHEYSPEYYIPNIEGTKKIKEGLLRYGKYFGIPCYPRKLIKEIAEFFVYAEEHNNLLSQLQEISKKKIGKDNQTMLLGSLNLVDVNLEGYNQNTVKQYETVSNYIKQEKPELLKEMEASNKKIREKRHKIVERFESFLKDNSLEKPIMRKVYL